MHIYWASVFILPSRVLLDIEQIIRGFLWCQGIMCKGKANVSWEDVCRPKKEGGLGLRRLDEFNKALMISHVWKLISLKESLWVQWIHKYKIRGQNFWDIPFRGNMTWGWRKILQLRPVMRDFIWLFGILLDREVLMLFGMTWFGSRIAFRLWSHVKKFACMDNMVPMLNSIISYLSPITQRRSTRCVIANLVVAASAYFIWQERNWRLFKNKKRSATHVIKSIMSLVRLKLLSCRFKKSKDGVTFAQLWDLPESIFISS
ncbi:hypothetical protein Tco_0624609 [Tanacetum coccineum]|uniref:Reverse transcriptase zinc-binding domain-containing protein n=1 Tax=Tanacetum coccineum TaxID=301880 RepID=A0ABQ4WEF1_9ASTR